MESKCLYEDNFFLVISPAFPLNSREDGGHLILIKKENGRIGRNIEEMDIFVYNSIHSFTITSPE